MHTDFSGVEQHIRSLPSLSLQLKEEDVCATTTKEFLEDFLRYKTMGIYTVEGGEVSGVWLRRTITDMYRLCQTYCSPVPSLYEMCDILCQLISEGKLICYVCGQINKRVWRNTDEDGEVLFHEFGGDSTTDEYDLDYSEFIERYSISRRNEHVYSRHGAHLILINYK